MSKKISQLPLAATPLTGTETLPLMQAGNYRKAGIGVAQIAAPFGDLPTDMPVGKVIYVPDAAGGSTPAYWTGTQWNTFGQNKRKVKPTGAGVFIVCAGPSLGVAHYTSLDVGLYFYSRDGLSWGAASVGALGTHLAGGITNTAYANGTFLFIGYSDFTAVKYAKIIQTHDPRPAFIGEVVIEPEWLTTQPYGYSTPTVGSEPDDASEYDEPHRNFTVPLGGVGNVLINNPLPRAVTPNPNWPIVGDSEGLIVEGVGSSGPIDVRINTINVTVTNNHDVPEELRGVWATDILEVKPMGTAAWQKPTGTAGDILSGDSFIAPGGLNLISAGLSLRGLLWGPIKDSAVKFLPGGN